MHPETCTPEVARELAERLGGEELRHAAQQQRTAIDSMPTADAVAASLTDRFGP